MEGVIKFNTYHLNRAEAVALLRDLADEVESGQRDHCDAGWIDDEYIPCRMVMVPEKA